MTDVRLQTQIEKGARGSRHDQCGDEGPCARTPWTRRSTLLDRGKARVAEKLPGAAHRAEFVEGQPVAQEGELLLSFRLNDNALIDGGPGPGDLVEQDAPSKMEGWGERTRFKDAGFRAVPGAIVRQVRPLSPAMYRADAELRQSRRLCRRKDATSGRHLGHGRLLRADRQERASLGRRRDRRSAFPEPLQAIDPTIIEDDCFIGAAFGGGQKAFIIGEGSVLSMGVLHLRFHQGDFITARPEKFT